MNLKKRDVMQALGLDTEVNWLPVALAGFGVGCLVGAGVAILLAPKSGRELREDLRERGRGMMHRGRRESGAGLEEQGLPTP